MICTLCAPGAPHTARAQVGDGSKGVPVNSTIAIIGEEGDDLSGADALAADADTGAAASEAPKEEAKEAPKEEPKKALDPHEDDKLSGDMRELYDRLQPTKENTDLRNSFVRKVQRILEAEFPENEFRVNIFGSSGNMLWTSESDGS